MSDNLRLARHFPSRNEIPIEHRLPEPVHQRCVLIDGQLEPWAGACQTVVSPIWAPSPEGVLEPIEIGLYPKGSGATTEAALAAAVAATTTAAASGRR